MLQDRARGNPALEEIVRALPSDERVTASFVHHRGSSDEPQLIEIWLPPGIRIAPFTQELYRVGFGLWGENAGSSNCGSPGRVAAVPGRAPGGVLDRLPADPASSSQRPLRSRGALMTSASRRPMRSRAIAAQIYIMSHLCLGGGRSAGTSSAIHA